MHVQLYVETSGRLAALTKHIALNRFELVQTAIQTTIIRQKAVAAWRLTKEVVTSR